METLRLIYQRTEDPLIIGVPLVEDARGQLRFLDEKVVPFVPRRIFYLSNVPKNMLRGGHAHKECQQYLVCLNGLVKISYHNFKGKGNIILEKNFGLHIPTWNWISLEFQDMDTQLLVLASDSYEIGDYIYELPN